MCTLSSRHSWLHLFYPELKPHQQTQISLFSGRRYSILVFQPRDRVDNRHIRLYVMPVTVYTLGCVHSLCFCMEISRLDHIVSGFNLTIVIGFLFYFPPPFMLPHIHSVHCEHILLTGLCHFGIISPLLIRTLGTADT